MTWSDPRAPWRHWYKLNRKVQRMGRGSMHGPKSNAARVRRNRRLGAIARAITALGKHLPYLPAWTRRFG